MKNVVNVIVIVVMVVIANYPLYKNLKETANEVNEIAYNIKTEISSWKKEVSIDKAKYIINSIIYFSPLIVLKHQTFFFEVGRVYGCIFLNTDNILYSYNIF